MVTPGVLPDLQSGNKKCPNLLGSADLQSAAKEYALPYVGGLEIPGLIGRPFFLRRISNPPGRLAGLRS